MAIALLQQQKKQKYLVFVFVAVLLITFLVVWRGALVKPKVPPDKGISPGSPPVTSQLPKVEINFQVLENPLLKKMETFPVIPPLTEGIGRENPFLPY